MEALLARRFHRGKGKFKGKLPIICFNCNEVSHIFVRCPEKKSYRGGVSSKEKEMKIAKITQIKVKSATLLKRMIQMNMMMKLFMLQ